MKRLILDRYEQIDPKGAGQGVSGIVIKARDTRGEHGIVALKRPNPVLSPVDIRKKSAQIKREGEALRRLDHPNACRYVMEQELSGLQGHYLVMGWAEGVQLESRLRELERTGETFPPGEALEILDQLAGLLTHAHERQVIHNDIDAKHLFWNEAARHLTVIDWANCGLGSDARPIATEADDLKQYGELMHRLLTGSTLDIATRLGKDSSWRVELEDRKIDPILQKVVARAVARDDAPYQRMKDLATDLRKYQRQAFRPFEEKVNQIDGLLAQQSTYDTLAQAKALITEVAVWDPTLVFHQQALLEQIELERTQNLALVRAKVAVRNEEWRAAHQRVAQGYGSDPQAMSLEARLVYWISDLLDQTKRGSAEYDLRKQAAAALLLQEPADAPAALDYLLLSYGPRQPDHDPLLAELARQAEQPYPPLRSRLSGTSDQADLLLDLTVSDQLQHYQTLQKQLADSSNSARHLLEDLVGSLQEANHAAEYAHLYQKARDCFYHAFHIDPHNYRLYRLASLMDDLVRPDLANPTQWQQACDALAAQEMYSFAAAAYYLAQAREKITHFVQRNIEYMRQFRLDTAWADLETIRQEQPLRSPLIECTRSICAGYRYLYGYAGQPDDDIPARLKQASEAWQQARDADIATGSEELKVERDVLTGLIEGYSLLYDQGLSQVESIQARLAELPHQESHRLIRQLRLELERLAEWKERYETLLAHCSRHDYTAAFAYVSQHQENDKDREVFDWLALTKRPSWPAWQRFCDSARQGLSAWQERRYEPACENFSAAQAQLPPYIDGHVPPDLKRDIEEITGYLEALQARLEQSRTILANASDFESYQPLPGIIKQLRQSENGLVKILGGEPRFSRAAELAGQFVDYARQGALEELQQLLARPEFAGDPLLAGYQRIIETIARALPAAASLAEVEAALKLAPASRAIQQRKVEVERFEQTYREVMAGIRQADIKRARQSLVALKREYTTLPVWLHSLAHLLTGYGDLAGPVEETGPNLARERISRANRALGEARTLFSDSNRAELEIEIKILAGLVMAYWGLNQDGLAYLESAGAKLRELQTEWIGPEPHQFIVQLAGDLAGLESWQQRRQDLMGDVAEYQYLRALKRLEETPANEQNSVRWLDETHRPDLSGWKALCQHGRQIVSLWQARDYGPAAAELVAAAKDKLPTDLSPAIADRLREQYQKMAEDLKTLQGCLDESRKMLVEAGDASTYDRVDMRLRQAREIEATYPAVVNDSFIATIQERYEDFRRLELPAGQPDLQRLVGEAVECGDPLASGYDRINTVMKRGQAVDASPEEVEIARKLTPDGVGDAWRQEHAGPVVAMERQRRIVDGVLAHIHTGDLNGAGQVLKDRPRAAATDCLWQIYAGYQYLYGPASGNKARPTRQRLATARQALDAATVTGVTEPDLKRKLEQEIDILDDLIWAYNEVYSNKLANLDRIRQDQRLNTLVTTQTDHVYVDRLMQELDALDRLKERWQRISNSWHSKQYKQAWQEMKEVTPPERAALVWLNEDLQATWQKWQQLSDKAQPLAQRRLLLLAGLALFACLLLFVCYQVITLGLAAI